MQLVFPLFAASFAGYPLSFSSAGQAKAWSGPADVIEAKGPGKPVWRLWLDAKTHLPVAISWMAKPPVRLIAGGPPLSTPIGPGAVTARPQDPLALPLSARGPLLLPGGLVDDVPDVEWRIEISDYRTANGVHWPHRLISSYPGQTMLEVQLKTFTINPTIDPATFSPAKTSR